jgi:cytochrome P450
MSSDTDVTAGPNVWPSPPFDYRDPELRTHEEEYLRTQREQCPVMRSNDFGGYWALTRFADIAEAAHDHEHFSTTGGPSIPSFGRAYGSKPLTSDPPEHAVYRRILQPYFTPAAVETMEPTVRGIVRRLVAGFAGSGGADLMKVLAEPVPAEVMAVTLGLDPSRASQILEMNKKSQGAAVGEDTATVAETSARHLALLTEEIETRRTEPRDDLLSAIVHARVDGQPITDEIRYGMAMMLIIAGVDTTISGIANTLMHLARYDTDFRAHLLEDREALDRFIAEALRFDAPVFGLARTVKGEVCMRGVDLHDGDRVLLLWGSGNHDGDRFPDPDTFDPTRKESGNLTFGWGRHRCLGDHLAKLEIRVAVEEVLAAMPGYRLAPDAQLSPRLDLEHGPRALEVVW